jgi:ABC-type nitrate/sulfonate/bicarbonate transport system substrate-binding protein
MNTSGLNRRIGRRRFFTGTVKAGLAGGIALFGPAIIRAQAQSKKLDRVEIAVAVGSIEFVWAVLKGRKIDHKHGLDAQVQFLDANAINQGAMIGRFQVSSSQPITAAIANNAGKNITIFAPALWNNMSGIVPVNSKVTSLSDLVGKKIALLAKLSGVYTSTQVIAAERGLDFEKQFNIVTGPPPAVSAFLQRGDVDAAIQIEPIVSSMLLSKKYKLFLEANQVWKRLTGDDMMLGCLAADEKWLDANRDVAKRLVAAVLEAGQTIRSDLKVFDEYATTLRLKTPEEIEFAKHRLPSFYPSEWTERSLANVNRLVSRAVELGIVKKPRRDFIVRL